MILAKKLLIVTNTALLATFLINWGRLHAGFHSVDLGFLVGIPLLILILGNLLVFKYIRGKIYSTAMIVWSWMFLVSHYFMTNLASEDNYGFGTVGLFLGAALINIVYLLIVSIVVVILTKRAS